MAIYSMTAFSRQSDHEPNYQWSWELRSVNHRYLEIQFKLPEMCRPLEAALRSAVKAKLKRGKVDITLQLQQEKVQSTLVINTSAAQALITAIEELQQLCGDRLTPRTPSTTEMLAWPGILSPDTQQAALPEQAFLSSFDKALDALLQQREREGAALAKALQDRLPDIRRITTELRQHVPAMITHQRDRLLQRIQEFEQHAQKDRIEQELAIYAQRLDIDEEIDRLAAHLTEIDNILAKGGPVGRRLDFLMQELNREANTIGSKSGQIATGQAAIDLKVLIEQMREQIQNIE